MDDPLVNQEGFEREETVDDITHIEEARDGKCVVKGEPLVQSQALSIPIINGECLVVNNREEVKLEDEHKNEGDDMLPLKSANDGKCTVEIETLAERQVLNVQVREDENNQIENLFHTRCFVSDKVCSVIIDGESYTNWLALS